VKLDLFLLSVLKTSLVNETSQVQDAAEKPEPEETNTAADKTQTPVQIFTKTRHVEWIMHFVSILSITITDIFGFYRARQSALFSYVKKCVIFVFHWLTEIQRMETDMDAGHPISALIGFIEVKSFILFGKFSFIHLNDARDCFNRFLIEEIGDELKSIPYFYATEVLKFPYYSKLNNKRILVRCDTKCLYLVSV
ncbi:hypothetical protein ACJX0J_041144, partial [Zea mays]